MADRTLTDTATISWNEATANQIKANVVDGSITAAKLTDDYLTAAEGNAAYQPLDSDLTAIAALTTTAYGRALLALADAAALGALVDSLFLTPAEGNAAYQPLAANLTEWATLNPTANAGSLVTAADYAAMRALLDLEAGTDFYSISAADTAFLSSTEGDAAYAILGRQIISGNGLTGGGDLSANRTLVVGAGSGITVNADDVALDTSSSRNVDHSGVTLTAGGGLTGGGDITASRSFAVGAGTGITVNADDVALSANQLAIGIAFIIDGGGSAITTGVKGFLEIPFACTITGWTMTGDQSGSIVIDVWKDTYANYPPTVADTITASDKPTISAATKGQDLAPTGWTTAVAAGDVLGFNVDSITTLTYVTLIIRATKT